MIFNEKSQKKVKPLFGGFFCVGFFRANPGNNLSFI